MAEIVLNPDSSRHGVKSTGPKPECKHLEMKDGRCTGCGAHHIFSPEKTVINVRDLIRHIDRGLKLKITEVKNGSDKNRSQ